MMKSLLKIPFLLTVVLACGLAEPAYASASQGTSEYKSSGSEQDSSVYPDNGPNLYCIHHQGKTAVNLLRQIPVPNAENDPRHFKTPDYHIEAPISHAVSEYLSFARNIERSLTIRELLFPFHHFL